MALLLADRFGRVRGEAVPMTEAEAYTAWLQHVRECRGCTGQGPRCSDGRTAYLRWEAAQRSQAQQVAAGGRR